MGGLGILVIMGALTTMLLLFIIILVLLTIYALIQYIFESIYCYRQSIIRNDSSPAKAWIPFYNKILLGELANNKTMGWILFIIDIINITLIIISWNGENIPSLINTLIVIIICVLMIIHFIINIILAHKIMKKSLPKYADILTVINVLTLGSTRSIFLFINRNKKE